MDAIKRYLTTYLDYVNWRLDKEKSLQYFKYLHNKCSISYYRKQAYQIRNFLLYCNQNWVSHVKLPSEPETRIKRVIGEDIKQALEIVKRKRVGERYIALIYLGASSGLRAEEIYQLHPQDIDIENRIVYVNHDPRNGQTTKTGKHRVAIFNKEAQKVLTKYLRIFHQDNRFKKLFAERPCQRAFRDTLIKIKDLRKFFSQEWDRRGGPTSIKKILMGHSLRNDVDLMHYNCQSKEDLKIIYDKVMNGSIVGRI